MIAAMEQEAVNTYEQLKFSGGGIAIIVSYGGARDRYVNGWAIFRVNSEGQQVATHPEAEWYDNGRKHISLLSFKGNFHQKRRLALDVAKNWVAEQGWYSGDWVRNRSGDYVPREINRRFPLRKNS